MFFCWKSKVFEISKKKTAKFCATENLQMSQGFCDSLFSKKPDKAMCFLYKSIRWRWRANSVFFEGKIRYKIDLFWTRIERERFLFFLVLESFSNLYLLLKISYCFFFLFYICPSQNSILFSPLIFPNWLLFCIFIHSFSPLKYRLPLLLFLTGFI